MFTLIIEAHRDTETNKKVIWLGIDLSVGHCTFVKGTPKITCYMAYIGNDQTRVPCLG
jgi:hypothetical protein